MQNFKDAQPDFDLQRSIQVTYVSSLKIKY